MSGPNRGRMLVNQLASNLPSASAKGSFPGAEARLPVPPVTTAMALFCATTAAARAVSAAVALVVAVVAEEAASVALVVAIAACSVATVAFWSSVALETLTALSSAVVCVVRLATSVSMVMNCP